MQVKVKMKHDHNEAFSLAEKKAYINKAAFYIQYTTFISMCSSLQCDFFSNMKQSLENEHL